MKKGVNFSHTPPLPGLRPNATRIKFTAAFWLSVYLALVIAPLLILILAPVPAKGGFLWDIGIGLGFCGLVMLVLQFFITARLRKPVAPFGIDVIYYFHRYLAYAMLLVVLAHPLLLLISKPAMLTRFDLQSLSWPLLSGVLSLLLLLLVVISSAWRRQLNIAYDQWRLLHLLLALAVVMLAFIHMRGIHYYSALPSIKSLWIAIAVSLTLIVLHVRLLRPLLVSRRPWQLSAVRKEQGDCWTLTLQPQGHQGIAFQAGQFCWLSINHSPFSMQEHPFSIASAPQDNGLLRFTIKELGDFTKSIGATPAGSTVFVDGPYGVFTCERHDEAAGYIFISGGIGLAPVLGMLQALAQKIARDAAEQLHQALGEHIAQ
jgi:predicted ferric reductase